MKLTAILLTVAFLQVQAHGYSQKLVTLNVQNASLKSVFNQITKQTGYVFFYEQKIIEQYKAISIKVTNAPIDQVLQFCFKDLPLTYNVIDNVIVVKQKVGAAPVPQNVQQAAPPIDISGRVTDADGNALAGANIKVKGSNVVVNTDNEGRFTLKGVDENAVLEISYVGFENQIIAVKNKSMIIASLNVSVKELDATIIKGYYTTTRRLNTGNVSKVTAETISQQPVQNPLAALEGRVPGLYIQQGTGVPGGNFTVRLRGQNSILNGNDPLYIIDGVPFTSTSISSSSLSGGIINGGNPLNFINPVDIESIEVLKDADATAIYGSRGANGVILITTKKGKSGKTNFTFNVYSGLEKVTRMMNLLNTQQYLQMRHEAFNNDGAVPGPSDYDINGTWDTTRYTDWQKLLIGGTAHVNNIQASVSGGSENTQFLIGGGYNKETTVFLGDFADQKGSIHFNLSHVTPNKKLKIILSSNFISDRNNLFGSDQSITALFLPPNAPALYDENGNLNWDKSRWTNPVAALRRKYKSNTDNIIANSLISYNILKGLELKVNAGYTKMQMKEIKTQPKSSLNPAFTPTAIAQYSTSSIKTWIVEPQLNWTKDILGNKINLIIGCTFQENIKEGLYQAGIGYSNDALIENIMAASTVIIGSYDYSQYHYNAGFARIGYNYKDKYLINLTGRRDGSSRFGPEKQFANFGSIAGGWIFSTEKFIQKKLPFLSYGKFRASYGVTGNDQIGDYQYLDTYSPTSLSYQGTGGLFVTSLFNPDFGWESNKKFETSIELGFAEDRVFLSTSYFRNRSSNMLVGYPLPLITGGTSVQYNLPALVENYGWEFELKTFNVKSKDFVWTTFANVSIPRNRLVNYPDLTKSTFANTYVIGKSLYIKKSFQYQGVNPQTGIFQFTDFDGNGILSSPEDRQSIKEITQTFFGGLQNIFDYKRFQLNVFFQFVKQTGRNYLYTFPVPGIKNNAPTVVMDRWQKPGEVTDVQKFTQNFGSAAAKGYSNANSYGDNNISDASFIRLKNLSLSYQLRQTWLTKMHLKETKIYFEGQNLFTITNYLGADPESLNLTALPPLRILAAGIQFMF